MPCKLLANMPVRNPVEKISGSFAALVCGWVYNIIKIVFIYTNWYSVNPWHSISRQSVVVGRFYRYNTPIGTYSTSSDIIYSITLTCKYSSAAAAAAADTTGWWRRVADNRLSSNRLLICPIRIKLYTRKPDKLKIAITDIMLNIFCRVEIADFLFSAPKLLTLEFLKSILEILFSNMKCKIY